MGQQPKFGRSVAAGSRFLGQGKTLIEVACLVGPSDSSVSRRRLAMVEDGKQALAPKPLPGPPSQLSEARKRWHSKALASGPHHRRFATELLTSAWMSQVIRRLFDVDDRVDCLGMRVRRLGWSEHTLPLRHSAAAQLHRDLRLGLSRRSRPEGSG